jgi:ApeA N-terminal domain 1
MARQTHNQNDRFSVRGQWWLPNSDRKIAGKLRYNQKDVSLSLFGGFTGAVVDPPFSPKLEQHDHSLIYGASEDNSRFTVLNGFYVDWKADATTLAVVPGKRTELRSSKLHCPMVLEGVHLPSTSNLFAKCRVEIPCFDAWLGILPFAIEMKKAMGGIVLDYTRPATEEFRLDDAKCSVRFIHAFTPPFLPLGSSPAVFHQTYLEVEPFEPLPLDRLLEHASEIVNFLSVVYGGPLLSKKILLFEPSRSETPIAIFYPRHKVSAESYGDHKFLIRYGPVKSVFPKVLTNWLDASSRLKQARRMLVSSERRPSKFSELRFLPLAHAAEILSNEIERPTFVQPAEFKKIRTKMLASVQDELPPDLVASIKSSLQWANGRSLRDKLQSLLGGLQEDTRSLFCVDRTRFIAGVVNTRNHYTHYSTDEGKKIPQDVELHWAIEKLRLMLRILLLVRAGVPEQEIQVSFRSNTRLAQERRVWQDVSEEGSAYSDDLRT